MVAFGRGHVRGGCALERDVVSEAAREIGVLAGEIGVLAGEGGRSRL